MHLPPELIIVHLLPHLPPDALLSISQTTRGMRACVAGIQSRAHVTAGVPNHHPLHLECSQLLSASNKWACIQYAILHGQHTVGR